jgi:hypothetical protein
MVARIAGVPADSQTGHLLDTGLERYSYAKPLGTKFTWNVIQANMASVALAGCIREFRTNKYCIKTDPGFRLQFAYSVA